MNVNLKAFDTGDVKRFYRSGRGAKAAASLARTRR